jgi:Na+/H+-translocating membrane pyrophosphatase
MDLTWAALAAGVLAMLVAAYLAWSINKESAGTPLASDVSDHVEKDVDAFKERRYIFLLIERLLSTAALRCLVRSFFSA